MDKRKLEGEDSAIEQDPQKQQTNAVDIENLWQQKRLKRYEQDTSQRRDLATWMKWVNSLWLGFVALMVIFGGAHWLQWDSAIFCTLLGTTTVNVLGLAYIILKGLFEKYRRDI